MGKIKLVVLGAIIGFITVSYVSVVAAKDEAKAPTPVATVVKAPDAKAPAPTPVVKAADAKTPTAAPKAAEAKTPTPAPEAKAPAAAPAAVAPDAKIEIKVKADKKHAKAKKAAKDAPPVN